MSYKKIKYLFLILLIGIALACFFAANQLPTSDNGVGPQYFPQILSILLIILCVASIFSTAKKEDERFEIPNIFMILLTIGLIICFILLWSSLGQFYIVSFIFISSLILLFTPKKRTIQHILSNLGVSLVITVSIYLLFTVLMNFNL